MEGVIPEFQFGFKEGHSTCDVLSLLDGKIQGNLKNRKFTGVCSLDIKKAFDSVWHEGLLYKLDCGGVDRRTTRLVQSFLNDREAVVEANGTRSAPFKIERGVPQGSRLGPKLYNIYIGDLKTDEKQGSFKYQFADDTLLGSTSVNAALATRRIEEQFIQVNNFFNDWGIEVNEEKTIYMIAAPPKVKRKRKYKRFGI